MTINEQDLSHFKALYSKHFHIYLSDEEAREKLTKLVLQLETIYRPIAYSDIKQLIRPWADVTPI